jgi:hypothetical protein
VLRSVPIKIEFAKHNDVSVINIKQIIRSIGCHTALCKSRNASGHPDSAIERVVHCTFDDLQNLSSAYIHSANSMKTSFRITSQLFYKRYEIIISHSPYVVIVLAPDMINC